MVTEKSNSFDYPECWADTERMNALYAPFRNRNVNPLNYDTKMEFWKKMIEKWCLFSRNPVFNMKDFCLFFQRDSRRPLCLQNVVQELIMEKEVKYLDDFLKETPPDQSWSGWAVNSLVKSPARWAFNQFKSNLFSDNRIIQDDTEFVHLTSMKIMAENFLKNVKLNHIYNIEELKDVMKDGHPLSQPVVNLITHSLALQGRAVKTILDGKTLVKFVSDGPGQILSITTEEKAAYTLKSQELFLIENIEKLELEKENLVKEAKSYLDRGLRKLAKVHLRKKMELEKTILKRVSILENIQSLLNRVKEVDSNSQVLETYQQGVLALESKIREAGLDVDKIDNTMNKIEQAFEDTDEIESTLSRLADPTEGSTDAEYEAELAALMLDDLPSVPSRSPIGKASHVSDSQVNDSVEKLRKMLADPKKVPAAAQ